MASIEKFIGDNEWQFVKDIGEAIVAYSIHFHTKFQDNICTFYCLYGNYMLHCWEKVFTL
jgi:hypothetical protein